MAGFYGNTGWDELPRIALADLKIPAFREAIDNCADAEALRSYLDHAAPWLAKLRRTQPDRAREADAAVFAAWERVRRAEQDANAAGLPDWVIVGSDGQAAVYDDRKGWVAGWKGRVGGIERAPRSVARRRAALERLLVLNDAVVRRLLRRGSVSIALDAIGYVAMADGRLAEQEHDAGLPPPPRRL